MKPGKSVDKALNLRVMSWYNFTQGYGGDMLLTFALALHRSRLSAEHDKAVFVVRETLLDETW